MAGTFEDSTMTVNTDPVTTLSLQGSKSAFVIAYDVTSGSPVWAKQLGNSGSTDVRAIAAYGDRVYVAGVHSASIRLGGVWHNQGGGSAGQDVWVVYLRASE